MKGHRRLVLAAAPRAILGAVLLAAGFLKMGAGEASAEALANYRLLPPQANQILAVVMPWWEITLGVMLLLELWARACAGFAALLMAAFAAAVTSALARGLDITCGCFGTTLELKAGLPHVVANLILLALALWVVRTSKEPVAWPDPSEARLGAIGGSSS